ncbi:hypothetical protein QE152_g9286 [Popillia japonica]|uniref:Transposable element P transposase-like GTP-binding insertion domain-containing protein n=1 Tax=Popillia japonica TaxID=7064 RepID=A0AAW1M086_POPJA
MKVSVAAQVLSQRVAALMRGLARLASPHNISASGLETAEFLLLMDKVFDSVNGASIPPRSDKMLRCAATPTSMHDNFWTEAIQVFESMEFFNNKRK